MDFDQVVLCLIALVLAGSFGLFIYRGMKVERQRQEKIKKVRMQHAAFLQRLKSLTPEDKPLLVYNTLQGKYLAITTFEKLRGQSAEKLEIETKGGEKILVNRTCSMILTRYREDDILMIFIIGKIMSSYPRPFSEEYEGVGEENNALKGEYFELWNLAQQRMFRPCGDLYIQMGTKMPAGLTREEIERLNTSCYDPSEVWEALKADITESIRSRTRAG